MVPTRTGTPSAPARRAATASTSARAVGLAEPADASTTAFPGPPASATRASSARSSEPPRCGVTRTSPGADATASGMSWLTW